MARAQQFNTGEISPDGAAALGLPSANTREADFGINYFLRDGLKGIASYGRQFSSAGNANQWSFGIAYRFMVPLGQGGAAIMRITLSMKGSVTVLLCALTLASFVFAAVPSGRKDASSGAAIQHIADADNMRIAGEQRFHANCGRCHAAPQKFPPRMMATILRFTCTGSSHHHRRRPAPDSVLHDTVSTS